MLFDRDAADYLSREQALDPAFIEKDWYATQVLLALSPLSADSPVFHFAGGTSLSKGYGLIRRFSEDLDFRVQFEDGKPGKGQKRRFREAVLTALGSVDGVTLNRAQVDASSFGFKVVLAYPMAFGVPGGIRPNLQVDFSFSPPHLPVEVRSLSSMVSSYKGLPGELSFSCLSPVETAADKFCGLVWRVLKRDRTSDKDDPALLRHLHDLCALAPVIEGRFVWFAETAAAAFGADQVQPGRQVAEGLFAGALRAFELMQADELYRYEYQQFVSAMSYDADIDKINFDTALSRFGELARRLLPSESTTGTNGGTARACDSFR